MKSKSKADKKGSKHKKKVDLENFDSKTLQTLGKRLAEHKMWYELSNK